MVDKVTRRTGPTARPEKIFNYRRMFLDTPIAMHILDRKGKIQDVNRAWLQLMGLKKGNVLGRPFTDFIPAGERDNAMARFLARIEGKRIPERTGDRHYLRADGSLFPARTKDTIIKERGKVEGVITSVEDITPLRKMEDQRRRDLASSTGVKVASGMIDRLSQDLLAIQGFIHLIQLYMDSNTQKSKGYAEKILAQTNDMTKLFNLVREYQNLLTLLQKGSNNNGGFQTSDILLSLIGARQNLQEDSQKSGVTIDITPQGDIPQVRLHPKMMDALYYILKSSAAQPGEEENRRVAVNVAADGDSVIISITDNRKREEPVTIERLEEPPFAHGITFLYTEYLELSYALLCIKLHAGDLRISSKTTKNESTGKPVTNGTTFEITLRAAK